MSKQILGTALLACLMGLPAVAQDDTDDAVRVRLVTVETTKLATELELSGEIAAIDEIQLGFRQGGRVSEVLVEEGDRVVSGQALARLAAVQQEQSLNVAEAGLLSARAGQEQAAQASERADALLERGVGTRADADRAEQALSQAEGVLERSVSAVEQARRALQDAVLRSPQGAVITSKTVAPGQVVAAAQPVFELAAMTGFEAIFHVADDPMLRDALGTRVRLETIDIAGPTMFGVVTEVSPLVDPSTGTVTVRAQVQMPQRGTELLGASVRGYLDLAPADGVEIPWTALMRQGDAPAVWTVDQDNRVDLTQVEVGHYGDKTIFVADGLTDGQRVIGEGSQLLYPGRKVQEDQEGQE
ncbi:efflux RND transporter periplasmic adaptor subunit [Paracoccus sp. JM45]|uniref:efflux RND transporter periplasmic adaptor subunit n=1 Tax=Paracoccus sp. JM45 TaxID=2283626 RepID=UPI000E6CF18F|nr:efflux RND transporter periplasmic adaptor subunit [Paracoccus sp. JM45]RJE79296.1 efflux RND transporter periplasmic adaptor subunit [Paracoccus sp. JM45]